ncbi:MAG: tryptophan 7-halogenase [Sandaracinaceae bacterium]|nr:tryptophan 7-halogenase [Sandaracinaceae bacterium]
MNKVDVAILGGGLAGNLLARQLRRTRDDLSVLVVEPSHETSWKVGESTVEIASDYLVRRHGLSAYLYDRQLPKNGLRFFFDTPDKDADLFEMSELGSDHLPLFPTFQLDRARFEADLRVMTRAAGAELREGETVRSIEPGTPHRVTVRSDGQERAVEARWVVDCTGRARVLSRTLDSGTEVDHGMAAVWGRFSNVVDLDAMPNAAWRGRVRWTSRVLSTNHFCYPGYWIWFIPLGEGVISVGVVGEKAIFPRGARTPEGFLAFLREHAAVKALLEPAELLDVHGFSQLAYGTKQFFDGERRLAMVGDAAAFLDPFYSPGSDFISVQNDIVTDLIRRDAAGEDVGALAGDFDRFMQMRFEATLLLYQQQYKALGSFDIMSAKWNYDLATYYNLWLDDYMGDKHLDPRHVRAQVRRKKFILEALAAFRDRFRDMAARTLADGRYHRHNLGMYNPGTNLDWFWREVGTGRTRRRQNEVTASIFEAIEQQTAWAFEADRRGTARKQA